MKKLDMGNSDIANQVMIIGSGAVRAHPERGGTCQVVRIAGRNLLFDCGRCAVHNMSRFGIPVESIDEIYLSHLHFDHVCDLPMFMLLSWNNGRSRKLPIYGPKGTENFMEYGVREAYADDIRSRLMQGKNPEFLDWNVFEIREEGILREFSGVSITTLQTKHGGLDNHSFRIDSGDTRIVITSDTEPDPRLIEFCTGADLLIIECSGTKAFYETQSWGGWHMAPEDVGQLAREANVSRVVLKHLVIESFSEDPEISERMAETVRSIHTTGEVMVGKDGMQFEFNDHKSVRMTHG